MRQHYSSEVEELKAKTRVVADSDTYHARTPTNEPWCGVTRAVDWEVLTLANAETIHRLHPCIECFNLPPIDVPTQERLELG